jgi:hypothetical protein
MVPIPLMKAIMSITVFYNAALSEEFISKKIMEKMPYDKQLLNEDDSNKPFNYYFIYSFYYVFNTLYSSFIYYFGPFLIIWLQWVLDMNRWDTKKGKKEGEVMALYIFCYTGAFILLISLIYASYRVCCTKVNDDDIRATA